MATQGIPHKELTDPQLHELKGASTAEVNQVPVADGEGHTEWQVITPDLLSIDAQTIEDLDPVSITSPFVLNTAALSATTNKILADATTFTEANKNIKELAMAYKSVADAYTALYNHHTLLVTKVNTLLGALRTLGFITGEEDE